MIPIEGERMIPAYLAKHAREYCEAVGAIEINNISCLGDGDYRVMYWIPDGEKRKMTAKILKIPTNL